MESNNSNCNVTPPRLVVPYLRVSTDDKGQDPERQMLLIAPWAQREGLVLLKPAVDNGTSASKIERARARGQRLGRKPKEVALEEVPIIDAWRKEGHGWETVANLLNELRGVHRLTDKKVARARSISASALKRWDRTRRESVQVETAEMLESNSPVEMAPAIRSALEA